MPYFEFIWDFEVGGNVEHLAEHGVTPEEAEHIVMYPVQRVANRRRHNRMYAAGFTKSGRKLGVSYEHRDEVMVNVITAFDLE